MARVVLGAALGFLLATAAHAQGVAPGGPIGGSTAIGSGLGGVVGTGPTYPNGTNQSPQPTLTPVPPGGAPGPSSVAPSSVAQSATGSSTYYPPAGPSPQRLPSTEPMTMPGAATADVSFARGCWRTDVYDYDGHRGLTTWCFNEKGAGRVLYTRIDEPGYSCNARAEARYAGRVLLLHSLVPTCSDNRALPLGDLDCRQNGDVVHCSGTLPSQGPGERWAVGLYRVPR